MSSSSSTSSLQIPLGHKIAAASCAAVSGTSLVYPLDIIKSNIQMLGSIGQKSSFAAAVDVTKSIVRSNGLSGLYRGFGACLFGIVPEKAIKLCANDHMREYLGESFKPLTLGEEIFSGIVAGVLQLFVTVPYEHLKIRLQLSSGKTASEIFKELGARNIYRGFTATLWRDVPFCVVFFPLYANLKSWQSKNVDGEQPFYVGFTSGIIAGAVSGGLVTPADMLKTRIQMGKAQGFGGLIHYTKHIIKTEGMSSLFRGYQQRMAVISSLYGLVSMSYELQKRWLSLKI